MSAAASKRWRTVVRRRDGATVLRSPDGREWLGTAAEVRDAAMTPERRRMLADALGVEWRLTKPRTAERRELVNERRRNTIAGMETDVYLGLGGTVRLPIALAIRAEAAARSVGMTLDEWLADAAAAMIDAAADANGGELPLTRHERAALERIEWEGGAA